MPLSEAKKKSNKKWNDANLKERYDYINLTVPKGDKEVWQAYAARRGESLNAFIRRAVMRQLEVDRGSTPEEDSAAAGAEKE